MTDSCDRDTAIQLARHDERLKAVVASIAHAERAADASVKLAADELSRRLEILNHAHQQAVEVQATYLPREMFDAWKKETEARMHKIDADAREIAGRLWLPMIAVGGLAAAIGAAVARFVFP